MRGTADNTGNYKVVCVGSGGERIVISTHASLESAGLAANLIRNCVGFDEIQVEKVRRRRRRRRAS